MMFFFLQFYLGWVGLGCVVSLVVSIVKHATSTCFTSLLCSAQALNIEQIKRQHIYKMTAQRKRSQVPTYTQHVMEH